MELPDYNPKPIPAWLGGWMGWRHTITKKTCLFVRFFFTCSQEHQNGNIFVDIESFPEAMFEQAELQGTQMGPNGPPNA